jgi:hypothetical protein
VFQEYIAHGWKLCGIDRGFKAPVYVDWNLSKKVIEEDEAEGLDGAGLLHALSGTCALDIDDLETARPWLIERGVDIDGLLEAPESVRIDSGRYNRAKLLYRMKLPMRTITPKGSGIELRCATADGKSMQDVLPPTIHPETKKPYAWKYGDELLAHWSNLPAIPASLLALWRQLAAETPVSQRHEPRTEATVDKIRRAIYQHIKTNNVDVTDHAQWLDIGLRLHDQTGGAQEGLDIWDEWSATDTSRRKNGQPRYQGKEAIEVRYRSMKSSPGKRVVGMRGILAQLPADKDEFEVITEPESDEETTAQALKRKALEARTEALAKLEQRLVFVRNVEKYFDTERHKIILTESGLEHQFMPMMPKGRGGAKVSPVKLLKESSTKRYVDAIGFHPGEGPVFQFEGESYANSYRRRLPEPIEPTAQELEKISWLFDRIDDETFRHWLTQFYAHVVQKPGVKIKSAPLIWSETQGNGKTTLIRMIPALLVGHQYSREVNNALLASDFNDYLLNAWHINLTEFRAGSRGERETTSKKVESWIADDVVSMHPKGLPGYTMPNHLIVTGSSNFDDAASISNNDRKWAIHELRAPQFTEREQHWIYHEFLLLPRAAGVLRHYFLHCDTSGFNPSGKAPETAARQEMVEASASSDLEIVRAAFEEQSDLFARDIVLVPELTKWIHRHSPARPSMHRVGRMLQKPPFSGKNIQFRVGEQRFRGVIIRNHRVWTGSSGKAIMDHIQGLTDELGDDLGKVDLLA